MIENLIMLFNILVGSWAGYRSRALSVSGAAAAFAVGIGIYSGFGVSGLILIGIFFATSSYWSEYKSSQKRRVAEKLAKGSIRDWRQVLANGGTAALLGIFYFFNHDSIWTAAFAVAVASSNSDTWASEIGSLSKKNPFDIRTLTRMDKGTSGAVSLLGSFSALCGSLLIAIFSYFLFHSDFFIGIMVFLFGFAGNVIDTILGAFVQLKFICTSCGLETEKTVHCGKPTAKIKGLPLMDNDMVNFLSGFIAVWLAIFFIKYI